MVTFTRADKTMAAEYVDYAEYYDWDHAITLDIEFYLNLARQCGSPILELACGTGRLLVPLLEAGCEVCGIDISENMLALCQRKLVERHLNERAQLFLAGMAGFDLPCKDFVLAFVALRSFMHLLTQADQLACLQSARRHLQPGGLFVLSIIAPDVERLARGPSEIFTVRQEFALPNGHHVVRKERLVDHDVVQQVRKFEFKFEEFDAAGALVRERLVPLHTRYTFRFELQLLLERAELELIEVYRDYEKNPYDGTGELIAVARRL
jgi:SAM-dependent methyltransferase